MSNNLTELIAELSELPTYENLLHLVGRDIHVGKEYTTNSSYRVVLNWTKHKKATTRLPKECNGVVLELPSCKLLSYPAPALCTKYRKSEVVRNLQSYDISYAQDGTIITLYYYNDEWRMSSANGFDVSNYKWFSALTYWEAFMEVANEVGFELDTLNKSCCYTLGFRHHGMHPLKQDPQKIWFEQSYDLDANKVSYSPIGQLSRRERVNLSLDAMLSNCKNAYTTYIDNMRAGIAGKLNYGYILRSDHSDDILLESSLMQKLRTLLYDQPKMSREISENRLEYSILRAYLGFNTRFDFLHLFPQFKCYYDKYDAMFAKIIDAIMLMMIGGYNESDDKITAVASLLVKYIDQTARINVHDPAAKNIVFDFVMSNEHLSTYYTNLIV